MFGAALQFGAFDATPGADLTIGAPRAKVMFGGTQRDQAGGLVRVFTRSGSLDQAAYEWFSQASTGLAGDPEEGEHFGYSLPGSADYQY